VLGACSDCRLWVIPASFVSKKAAVAGRTSEPGISSGKDEQRLGISGVPSRTIRKDRTERHGDGFGFQKGRRNRKLSRFYGGE